MGSSLKTSFLDSFLKMKNSIMGKKEKLYKKAKESSRNLSFDELCLLAEKIGFIFKRQKGSHKLYKHPDLVHPRIGKRMNFQPDERDKSKAKRYQIEQLIEFIEYFHLIGE
jgi:hypothetical protein